MNIPQYQENWYNRRGYYSINIVITRGCPYRCNWCAKPNCEISPNGASTPLATSSINSGQFGPVGEIFTVIEEISPQTK